jgi:hypothetical protein
MFMKSTYGSVSLRGCVLACALVFAGLLTVRGDNASLTNGLTAHLPLDGTAVDAGPFLHPLTSQNIVPCTNRFGMPARAIEFSGTTSGIHIGDPLFNLGSNYTIAVWLANPDKTRPVQVWGNSVPHPGLALDYLNPGNIGFRAGNGSAWAIDTQYGPNNVIRSNEWHFVVFSKSNQVYQVILDGVPLYSYTLAASFNLPVGLELGSAYPYSQNNASYKGRMDDLRVYNRTLNLAEIGALYALDVTNAVSNVTYTVSFAAAVGGTAAVVQAQGPFTNGTVVQVQAVPDPGYQFLAWRGDALGSANPTSIVVTQNLVITPEFTRISTNSLENGLVAFLPMNGTVLDVGGYAHATTSGGVSPAVDRFGQSGGALRFSGSASGIHIADPLFNVGSNYSVCLWFNLGATNNAHQILFNTAPHPATIMSYSPPGTVACRIGNGTGWLIPTQLPRTLGLPTNEWHFAALVKQGSVFRMYFDGAILYSFTNTTALNLNTGLEIGATYPYASSGEPFKGSIDDFRVYNRSLDISEIGALFTPGVTNAVSNQTFTVAFNQTVGGTASVLAAQGSYVGGSLISLQAFPEPGYRFLAWQGSVTGTSNPVSLIINQDLVVAPQFERLATNQPADSLVAYLPMDGTAVDQGSYAHRTTSANVVPTFDRFGRPDRALRFSGIGSGVHIGDTLFNLGGDYSVCLWFALDQGFGTHRTLFNTAPHPATIMSYSPPGTVSFRLGNGSSWLIDTQLPRTLGLPTNEWHFAVFVKQGAVFKSFVDGTLLHAVTNTTPLNLNVGLEIGAAYPFTQNVEVFRGDMDDVRVFNRAIGTNEISSLHAEGVDANQFWLTVSAGIGGKVESVPAARFFTNATQISLTATPLSEYEFVQWTGDVTNSENPLTLTIDRITRIGAVFRPMGVTNSPSQGLLAWYQFDGNARDISGNGNHGTTQNVLTNADRFGDPLGALQFRRYTPGWVMVTNALVGPGLDGFTISTWFHPGSFAYSAQTLFASDLPYGYAVNFNSYSSAGAISFTVGNGTNAWIGLAKGTPLAAAWHQVVLRKAGPQYTLFVDGAEQASMVVTQSVDWVRGVNFGSSDPRANAYCLEGRLDDTLVYNRALQLAEILALQSTSDLVIRRQPSDLTVIAGEAGELGTLVYGTPPVSCQWYKDEALLPGKTNFVLAFSPASFGDAGAYQMVVNNASASITSRVAVVTVTAPPALAVSAGDIDFGAVAVHTTADRSFYVTNTGGATLTGTATVAAPFGIVAGASYSIPAGQSQAVVVRYSPAALLQDTATVSFTGAGGATRSVSGSGQISATELTFVADHVTAPANGTVVLPVYAYNFTDVVLFQYSMHWNSNQLVFLGVEQFGLPGLTLESFGKTETGAGTLSVSWDDATLAGKSLTNGGVVFGLRFQVLGSPGSRAAFTFNGTPVGLEAARWGVDTSIPIQTMSGEIIAPWTVNLAGSVNYYDGLKGIPGAVVEVTGATNIAGATGMDGAYNFHLLPGNGYTVTPYLTNDVDEGNGAITSMDISLIRRHILNPNNRLDSPYKVLAADVNNSGTVSTMDILLLRRVVLGETNRFPATLWRLVPADYTFADPLNPWAAPSSRSYANVPNNLPGQNWVAVHLGDVNNTWNPPAPTGEKSLRTQKSMGLNQVRFQVLGASSQPGGTARVLVKVSGFREVTSAQFTLKWNPAALQLSQTGDYGLTDISGANFGTLRTNAGKVTFAWEDSRALGVTLADGSTLFSLTFQVLADVSQALGVELCDEVTVREVGVNFDLAGFVSESGHVLVVGPDGIRAGAVVASPTTGFSVNVQTLVGVRYVLECKESLSASEWVAVSELTGNGSAQSIQDNRPASTQRFYRLRVE